MKNIKKNHGLLLEAYKFRRNAVSFASLVIFNCIIIILLPVLRSNNDFSGTWKYDLQILLIIEALLIIIVAFFLKKFNECKRQLGNGWSKNKRINPRNNPKILKAANRCRESMIALIIVTAITTLVIVFTLTVSLNHQSTDLFPSSNSWRLFNIILYAIFALIILIPTTIYFITKTIMFRIDFGGYWPKRKRSITPSSSTKTIRKTDYTDGSI